MKNIENKIVHQAIIAFHKKNYSLALQLWKQASLIYGEKYFRLNIYITEKIIQSLIFNSEKSKENFTYNSTIDLGNSTTTELPSISVIIPTYIDNNYIYQCVNSVINQDYPCNKIKIIISVNGSKIDYYNKLCNKFSSNKMITVIYTSKKGSSAARNFAFQYVDTKYITYLDDDDYFTPRYIKELAIHDADNIDIICGRLIDYYEETDSFIYDTYINKVLEKSGGKISDNPLREASLLSSMCAKLYKKDFISTCSFLDEDLPHTEDIDFWVNNFQNIKKNLYICSAKSKEAYVRRIAGTSRSRPAEEKSFSFYITDRVKFIERFSKKLFTNLSIDHKRFILIKIDAQTNHMLKYYSSLSEEDKARALVIINKSNAAFLNKSKFGLAKGIAFCHNFSPFADASAYVATKRLSQISDLYGKNIYWNVLYANMHTRQRDDKFEIFFSRYQYAEKHIIGDKAYFNEKAQWEWGKKAFESVNSYKAEVIYSRSMWVGSHVAAYLYKKKFPNTKWYAEFSDPIYMGTDNRPRKNAKIYEKDLSFLNTFWKDIESIVMNTADIIIFTNNNQKKYMFAKNELLKKYDDKKYITISHPSLPNYYSKLIIQNYDLDKEQINIGFFGSIYMNRQLDDLFKLLERSNVYLHIFTSSDFSLFTDILQYKEKIKINKQISYFEFLNIASQMDYLYLNDINFSFEINPYLPSKITDYLITGTPILAKIVNNSPLSMIKHPNIIFINENNNCLNINLKKK